LQPESSGAGERHQKVIFSSSFVNVAGVLVGKDYADEDGSALPFSWTRPEGEAARESESLARTALLFTLIEAAFEKELKPY
jgi:hypothetical protein